MKFKGCLSLSKCNLSTAQRVDCEKPDIIRSVFIKCFFFDIAFGYSRSVYILICLFI